MIALSAGTSTAQGSQCRAYIQLTNHSQLGIQVLGFSLGFGRASIIHGTHVQEIKRLGGPPVDSLGSETRTKVSTGSFLLNKSQC